MSENYLQRDWKSKGPDKKEKNGAKTDYTRYRFSGWEILRYSLEGALVVAVISYFFYRSFLSAVLLSPVMILYIKEKRKSLCRRRKMELSIQFKDALQSIDGSFQAGYSIENAFSEAYRDMVEYHGAESVIAKELFAIKAGIRNNRSVEELVEDLGDRSGVEDICDFAGILRIGKQSGGNLHTLFENSITVIEEKLTVRQEIQTIISSKRLEANIMCIIPFFIILYVDITSKGYFDALYTTTAGKILMSLCLVVYLFAFRLSRKIMEIEV